MFKPLTMQQLSRQTNRVNATSKAGSTETEVADVMQIMRHDELKKKANFFYEHYDVYDGVMLDVYVQHQAFDADGKELSDENGCYFPANVDDDEDTQVHEHKFKFDF